MAKNTHTKNKPLTLNSDEDWTEAASIFNIPVILLDIVRYLPIADVSVLTNVS